MFDKDQREKVERRKKVFDKLAEMAVNSLPATINMKTKLSIMEYIFGIDAEKIPAKGALADYVAETIDWLARDFYINRKGSFEVKGIPPCPEWLKDKPGMRIVKR